MSDLASWAGMNMAGDVVRIYDADLADARIADLEKELASVHERYDSTIEECNRFSAMYASAVQKNKQLELATWQPIETAPKDGTQILVMGKKRQFVARFENNHWLHWKNLKARYWDMKSHFINPTHWKPLGPPPAQGASDE